MFVYILEASEWTDEGALEMVDYWVFARAADALQAYSDRKESHSEYSYYINKKDLLEDSDI